MKILKAKEKSRKETIVDAETGVVECHHATVHPSLEKGCRYQMLWLVDLSKTPQEQILRAAAEYCIIAARRDFAKVKSPKNDDWNNVVIDANPLIPRHVSKVAKARAALEAFSPEELAEMGIVLTPSEQA